jgi:hypothetical protein
MPLQSDPSLKPPEPTIIGFASTWDNYACMYYNLAQNVAPHCIVQLFTVKADRDPPVMLFKTENLAKNANNVNDEFSAYCAPSPDLSVPSAMPSLEPATPLKLILNMPATPSPKFAPK